MVGAPVHQTAADGREAVSAQQAAAIEEDSGAGRASFI